MKNTWKINIRDSIRSPLFYRFSLFYTTLLLLPILLMVFFVNGKYNDSYADEMLENYGKSLKRFEGIIESNVLQISRTAFLLSQYEYLLKLQWSGSPYHAQKLISELKRICATSDIVHDILVILDDQPFIYGSASSYTYQTLVEGFYPLDALKTSNIESYLYSMISPVVLPSESLTLSSGEVRTIILEIYPLPYESRGRNHGLIIFLVDLTRLEDLLFGNDKRMTDSLVISKPADHPLAVLGQKSITDELLTDNGYLRLSRSSGQSGLHYTLHFPGQDITDRLKAINGLFLTTVALIAVIGGVLIFLFMRYSYRPIGELRDHIAEVSNQEVASPGGRQTAERFTNDDGTDPVRRDELTYIRSSFDEVMGEVLSLKSRIAGADEAVKEYFIYRLLQGNLNSADLPAVQNPPPGIRIDAKYHTVAVILLHAPETMTIVIHALEWFEAQLQKSTHAFGRMSIEPNTLIFIINDDSGHAGSIAQTLSEIHAEAKDSLGINITIGLGRFRENLDELPQTYIEACAALDYRIISGNSSIITYDTIADQEQENITLPVRFIDTVRDALRERDFESAEAAVEEITETLREQRPSLAIAKMIYFSVMNTIVESLVELNPLANAQYDTTDIFSVARIETFEELTENLATICRDVFVVLSRKQSISPFCRQILDYINEHYTDFDVAIQTITEHFDISHTYLNNMFKREVSCTPLSHINTLRLNRTKLLLRTTRMPLKQIVAAVGYKDTSNFIRKFRETEKLTPGEYRKLFFGT
jgi:two-component system, response regulator YesN